jgi:protein O-GlcNAc transferase
MSLNYYPPYSSQAIAEEHFLWDQRHAQPLTNRIKTLSIDDSPNRRLRIGYLSPDFREHVVAFFASPILASHDHTDFEIFCYANVAHPDSITARFQKMADHWRNIDGISDERTAEMIREDRIDILVDLAGHSGDHRLLVLARKPAPIQATYVGYPATTGLKTVDYRITDAVADPPGMTESLHSEQLARLPRCNWCYEPLPEVMAAVTDPPNPEPHPIVFACFTNPAKVNQETINLWGQILQQVPGSSLVLKAGSLGSDSVRQRFAEMMTRAGMAADRFQLIRSMGLTEHLKHFNKIDIFLDTFPYNGTTTTCETLWMGVPVVTLAGKSHVSRVSASLLTAVGLPELIADAPDQYVKIAVDLAHDLPRLTHIRSTLRQNMKNSPLCDGPGMARAMEELYREMWKRWCDRANSKDEIRLTNQ